MNTINQVALGSQGLIVSAEGIGLMGRTSMASGQMSVYGEAESIATIHRALKLGITLLDTTDIYVPLVSSYCCLPLQKG